MSQQFLFLFVAPDKGASNYRAKCELEGAVLHIAGSSSYEDAVAAAKHFTEKGV